MERLFKPVKEWQQKVIPQKERNIHTGYAGVLEEGTEFSLAVAEYDGTPEKKHNVIDEARDLIIRAAGAIYMMEPNVNLDLLVGEKVDLMVNKKYPADKVRSYSTDGDWKKGMARCKQEFPKSLTSN